MLRLTMLWTLVVVTACQPSRAPEPASTPAPSVPDAAASTATSAPVASSMGTTTADADAPSVEDTSPSSNPTMAPDVEPARSPEAEALARAAEEEDAWYAEDPQRRARIDALPAPTGDACRLVHDGEASLLVVGGVPQFFPFMGHTQSAVLGEGVRIMSHRVGDRLFVGLGHGYRVHSSLYLGSGMEEPADSAASTLWVIDCAAPRRRPAPYYVAPDVDALFVDFSHAVPSPEGDALYVTSASGISRFVITSKALEPVLSAIPCTPNESAIDPTQTCRRVLVPERMTDNGLEIVVGIPEQSCHQPGPDLESFIVDLASPRRDDPHTWRRVATLTAVAQADKALLLGHDGLWRSRDEGRTWARVVITMPAEEGETEAKPIPGVERIIVDAKRPRRVVLLTKREWLYDSAGPAALFTSDDGGARWRHLPLPEGDAPSDVWSVDGSVTHLAIVRGDLAEEGHAVLETQDGGKTWAPSQARPPERAMSLPAGLSLTPLGLWRQDGAERTLVFPPPHLDAPLWIDAQPTTPSVARAPIDWDTWDRAAAANTRGLAHAKAGRLDEAIAAYQEAWTLNPNSAVARYNAACAHARAGDDTKAMALIEALHERGGLRALQLLAAAADDADLTPLKKLARFRILTTATAPRSAYDRTTIYDTTFDLGDEAVMSDPHERLCLWVTSVSPAEDNEPFALARFDCTTGAAKGALTARTARELGDLLDDLGMVVWQALDAESPDHGKAAAWVETQAKAIAEREVTATFRSTSGRLIAARVVGSGEDGAPGDGLVTGDWPR